MIFIYDLLFVDKIRQDFSVVLDFNYTTKHASVFKCVYGMCYSLDVKPPDITIVSPVM